MGKRAKRKDSEKEVESITEKTAVQAGKNGQERRANENKMDPALSSRKKRRRGRAQKKPRIHEAPQRRGRESLQKSVKNRPVKNTLSRPKRFSGKDVKGQRNKERDEKAGGGTPAGKTLYTLPLAEKKQDRDGLFTKTVMQKDGG